ncbi:MAG: cell division protein SepF [Acholeplasmatales bacterium]|nr:cell division protein SepF [Acholeplasmatales bacterium]
MFFKKKTDEDLEFNEPELKASDRIVFAQFTSDDDNYALELINQIKDGAPIIINFEKVDEYTTNKYMAFFTGATMMVEGKVMRINENTILFTKKENFLDGTLRDFIEKIPHQ